jgi:putative ABC transport system permease protein
MTPSTLKQSLRILFKEKRITLINITGLSVSLACSLFMFLWVTDELSYDRFHHDYKQLYRVEEDQYYSGKEPYHVIVTPFVSGPVWKNEIPEITEQCRMAWMSGQLFRNGDQKFFEDNIIAADSSFFDMFNFPFKYGNGDQVLRKPGSMVLTEEVADRYFGNENPLGKTILVNGEEPYTVEGVLQKLPHNTEVGFNVLVHWDAIKTNGWYSESWGSNSIRTFVRLGKGSVDTVVNRKLTEVTDRHKENNTIDYMVAPLHRIHLHSYFGYGDSPGAILYVYIFAAVALFLLLIACINFMNLSTARSSIRAREIGLRKTIGASRGHLVKQHLFESFVQTLISVTLAFLLVLLFLGRFNLISGKEIEPLHLLKPGFVIGLLIILVLTTLLAGSYPALYLSGMKPWRLSVNKRISAKEAECCGKSWSYSSFRWRYS